MNTYRISPAAEFSLREREPGLMYDPEKKRSKLRMYLIRFFVLVFIMTLVLLSVPAKSATNETRKKVAVVLSGGGTKGMAHIGVLKALEENNIPVDFIAGTSIGAIIGSMYAAGYSPEEIEKLVTSEEFMQASTGILDSKYRQFFMERIPDPSWVTLYFSWEDRLEPQNIIRQNIPSNIVSPYLMDFLFMEYLGPASAAANYHFDNLFVPFRCIATDVASRSAVTMRDGSLSDAVRASMTFPFYFQPIEISGRLMMDGGMFNNFPADVVHMEFQPDVVIGSVVSDNPAPPARDNIISQLENLLMHPSRYDILTDQGVVIRPEVPDIAVNDMSRNNELIENGYKATLEKLDAITGFIDALEDPEARNSRRQAFRNSIPDKIVGGININGLKPEYEEFVLSTLGHESLPMTMDQFKQNYFSMLVYHRFDYVYPYLRFDQNTGFFIFNLEMEKSREMYRSFGGNISSRPINHIFGKFQYSRWSRTPLTLSSSAHLGNFYNNICFAAQVDFPGEAPLYVEGRFSYSRWEFARSSVFLIEEQHPPFLTQRELHTALNIGYPIGHDQKLEFGGAYATNWNYFFNTRNFSDTDTMDRLRFNPYMVHARFERNTLDRKQYPTGGSRYYFSAKILRGIERYIPGSTAFYDSETERTHAWIEVLFQYKNYFRPGRRFNYGIAGEIFLSQRPVFSNYTSTMSIARQFSPFPLTRTIYMPEFRANQFIATGFKSIYSLSRSASIQGEAHVFQPLKNIISDTSQRATYTSYSFDPGWMGNLAFVYHTAPGPFSVSMSYFHNEQEPWVFMINFGFLLFNNQIFM